MAWLLKMCDFHARAGVEERLVTPAEAQTKTMFEAMNRALDDRELTAAQRARARRGAVLPVVTTDPRCLGTVGGTAEGARHA
ncbi:hypothetical protein [Streptomyces sp. NPDC085596]|uniref:hypothetical protein n=1 Tax=Streptomyces sp. NPDC085596 TaxID=3365731 RepID=UPI0037D0A4CE